MEIVRITIVVLKWEEGRFRADASQLYARIGATYTLGYIIPSLQIGSTRNYGQRSSEGSRTSAVPLWDVEDMRAFGDRAQGCPYYASQAMVPSSQIIICPYNYLVNRNIRQYVLGGDEALSRTVVIVDEAHNLMSTCKDEASCDIGLFTLMQVVKDCCILSAYRSWSVEDSGMFTTVSAACAAIMEFTEKLIAYLMRTADWFEVSGKSTRLGHSYAPGDTVEGAIVQRRANQNSKCARGA